MQTIGPLYGGKLRYWHKKLLPIVEVGSTQETDYPFRKGKCLVFRLPFTEPGYYVGFFYKRPVISPDDDEAIDKIVLDAMKGRKAWVPEDGKYDEIF